MDRRRESLTRAIDYFTRNRLWGTITVLFNGGAIDVIKTSETIKPHEDRRLAAVVSGHPAVAAALQAGETTEFVFARLRGGRLTLLAVEKHHTEDHHARDDQQPRPVAGSPAPAHPR